MPITVKRLRELVKTFPWDDWNQDLEKGLMQQYRDLIVVEGTKAAESKGVEFNQDDPFLQKHMTEYVGERIVQLTKTTQKDVINTLRRTLSSADENLSASKLQELVLDTVREKFDDYAAFRALRIARYESGVAYNNGGVLGGMQAGFKHFEVFDGTDDEICAAANGQIWPAAKCLRESLGHPNCVRSFGPVDESEVPED